MYVQLGKFRWSHLFTYICFKRPIVMLRPAINRQHEIYSFKKIQPQIEQQNKRRY